MHVSEKSAIENAKRRLIEARKEWAKSLQGEAFIAMQRRGEIEKHIGRLSGYPTVERMFETIGEFVGKAHRELGDRVTELEAKPVMFIAACSPAKRNTTAATLLPRTGAMGRGR